MSMRAYLSVRASDASTNAIDLYMGGVRPRMHDLRPVWDDVLKIIWDYEKRLFEREGATEEHSAWEGLSDNPIRFHDWVGYKSWKARYYGTPILTLTGKLKGQLTGRRPAYQARTRNTLVFGTDYTDYDGVSGRPRSELDRTNGHDIGGVHAAGRPYYYPMPARPPIRVTRGEVTDIVNAVIGWILEGSRGGQSA